MDYPPTLKQVSWSGCALFTFSANQIKGLWIPGDLKNLEAQLKGALKGRFASTTFSG